MTLKLLLSLALCAVSVLAQADWTCSSSADCPAWYNASDHQISATSTCIGDPMQPNFGYCGWVGAACTTSDDCDYGSCNNGKCYGYYGAACSANNDCLGTLQCGSDKICGGEGGSCPNGNMDCASGSCTGSGSSAKCGAMPQNKMAQGHGCQVDDICASGTCGSDNLCTASAASGPGASARARHRARRDAHSHGRPVRSMFTKRRCAVASQTACLMGISSGSGLAYECVDTTTSLESCGGCLPVPGSNETQFSDPSAPAGVDCTALPNVEEVICSQSRCQILACRPGSSLNPDGSACSLVI